MLPRHAPFFLSPHIHAPQFDPRCETDPLDEGSALLFFAPVAGWGGSSSGGGAWAHYGGEGEAEAAAGAPHLPPRPGHPSPAATTAAAAAAAAAAAEQQHHHQQPLRSSSTSYRTAGRALAAQRGVCVARFSGPPAAFRAFLLPGPRLEWLLFKGRAKRGGEGEASQGGGASREGGGWGVQFSVTPLAGVLGGWRHPGHPGHTGAPHSCGLLTALAVLEALIAGAAPPQALARGVLHNSAVRWRSVGVWVCGGVPPMCPPLFRTQWVVSLPCSAGCGCFISA